MFGIDAAIYVYCTYVFVENKNLKPETWSGPFTAGSRQALNGREIVVSSMSLWASLATTRGIHFVKLLL